MVCMGTVNHTQQQYKACDDLWRCNMVGMGTVNHTQQQDKACGDLWSIQYGLHGNSQPYTATR